VPYQTYGNMVYLGRVGRDVRRRAAMAGLTVVNAKTVRRYFSATQVIQRMTEEGRWYDTVKYS
jgi:hypothetical protein